MTIKITQELAKECIPELTELWAATNRLNTGPEPMKIRIKRHRQALDALNRKASSFGLEPQRAV